MRLQAPAIVDVRVSRVDATSRVSAWLRGIGVRQVRLACGLVMFSYIFSHFSNHALGNVSYDAMEAWLRYHYWWWRNPVGTTVLYSAAIVHLSLGLWALYQRRHFRFAAAEITQLVAGLSIPFLLTIHIVGVRLNGAFFDRDINYASAFYSYWVARPYMEWVQFTVLIVAWTHACIGLHFWLRLKPFYNWAGPLARCRSYGVRVVRVTRWAAHE